jgi:hypothetical protein
MGPLISETPWVHKGKITWPNERKQSVGWVKAGQRPEARPNDLSN